VMFKAIKEMRYSNITKPIYLLLRNILVDLLGLGAAKELHKLTKIKGFLKGVVYDISWNN
jgi:hypothetical protein